MANIKTWTVLATRENANKILEEIPFKELQEAFAPNGVALKIDENMVGPIIGFYSIKTGEASYMTPLEFVEGVRADLWGAQRDYKRYLAEKKAKENKKKPQPTVEEKPAKKKKNNGGRVIG